VLANGKALLFEGVSLKGLYVRFKTDCSMVEVGKSWDIPTLNDSGSIKHAGWRRADKNGSPLILAWFAGQRRI
jgi:hypothetical protein